MIKNLRHKFILIAMFSTMIVLTLIMGVLNITNYMDMLDRADGMTELLAYNDGEFPDHKDDTLPDDGEKSEDKDKEPAKKDHKNEISEETPYETRYFTVTLDEDNNVVDCDLDMIAAVDESVAKSYAEKVSESSKNTGFSGIYRYRAVSADDGTKYVFLDCRKEKSNFRSVLITTIAVSILGLAAVFVLVVIFSRIVFRPVEESMRKQKRFITDASHELKTPLTIIDANTEVVEMENGESQWTTSTRKQVQRLTAMVQQMVVLSRLDEENGLENKSEFNISEAVADIVEAYEAPIKMNEKNLVLNIEENLKYNGDEGSIRQLTGILMDNALKYSSEKGNINLTLKKKGKRILFEIYNDADDLPEGKLNILFERFYRLDSSRNSSTGGSGIGLSVAQAIVQAHKGKIYAENKNGSGLTITILL